MEKDILSFNTIDEAKQYYFNYFRENGYPNYDISHYNIQEELKRVKCCKSEDIIIDKVARQVMTGCGVLWCFFPHWIKVKTFDNKSLEDCWKDDDKLHNMINKAVDWCINHEDAKMSFNRIRQLAKVYLCSQSPSNFRPTVSKALYDIYGNKGKIYDPCAGWGGRLFGFLASDCEEYVCCDPSEKTYQGLLNLYKAVGNYKSFHGLLDFMNKEKIVKINCICQEDYDVSNNYFDFVFTSPPYYDCEKYSEEPTQSYKRYNTYSKWYEGFLKPLIQKAYIALKPNSVFMLNIANTKNAISLESDSVQIAKDIGFVHEDTLKLALSSISGQGTKYEPMFVFRKIK